MKKHNYGNTHSENLSMSVLVSVILMIIATTLILTAKNDIPLTDDSLVQYSVEIYHHMTVTSDRLNGVLTVVEIAIDDTLDYACDGWNGEDENGHNCIIVDISDMNSIIGKYDLGARYPVIGGY